MDLTNKTNQELLLKLEKLQSKYDELKDNLQKDHNQFQDILLNTAMNGYWRVDANGKILEVNDAYCRMSGYNREDLLQMSISDIEAKETINETEEHIRRIIEYGKDFFETRHKRKDKSILEVVCHVHFIRSSNQFIGFFDDVSYHKQIEKELEYKKQQYEQLVKSSSSGIAFIDNSNIVQIVNEKAAAIWGLKPEDMIGKKVSDILSEAILPEALELIEKVKKTGIGLNLKKYVEAIDTYFIADVQPFYDTESSFAGVQVVITDITEVVKERRKVQKAEKKLSVSEEKYKRLTEDLPGMVYQGNKDWSVDIIANSKHICGYEINDFYEGKVSWLDLIIPEDRDRIVEGSRQLREKPCSISREYRILTRDNEIRYVSDKVKSVFNRNNDFEFVEGIVFDITEKKKYEEELEKSESIQRKMVSNIGDVIVIIDKDSIIRYKSPSVKKHFGWEVNDLIGKNAFEIIHPDDMLKSRQLLELVTEEPDKSITSELRCRNKKGDLRWIQLTLSNMLDDPEVNGFLGNYHDITEQKLLREEHLRNEQLLNETGRLAKIGGWELDIRTMTSYYSQETKRIYGLPANAEPPKGVEGMKFYPEEAQLVLQRSVNEAIEKGKSYDVEVPFINKQGKQLWVRTLGLAEKKNGKVTRLYGAIQDITEKKHAEEKLIRAKELAYANQAKYRKLSNLTFEGIFLHSEGYFEDCNRAFTKLTGYTKKELGESKLYKLLFSPENQEYVKSKISNKYQKPYETEIVKKDGTVIPVEMEAKNVGTTPDGRITRVVAFRDISLRKEQEALLQEKEHRLQAIINNTNAGTWEWNVSTGEVHYNERWAEMMGYTLNELMPLSFETWSELAHPDDKQKVQDLLEKHFKGETKFFVCEVRMKHKDGHWVWVLSTGRVMNYTDKGKPMWMSGTHQDITERKILWDNLVAAKEKAEESDRLKTAFLANMSHEIRTPLNAIVGFSSILSQEVDDSEKENILDIIDNQTKLLLKLVDDVVDAAKIDAGVFNIKKQDFDLNKTLDELTALYMDESKLKRIELRCQKNEGKMIVHSDEQRIQQIYINLLNNALKFTSSGSICFGYEIQKNSQLVCFVKDTGIGISEEKQDMVFERFSKVDEFSQGAGLGLSIVKHVIEKLNGRIWMESETGKGCCFYFQVGLNPGDMASNATGKSNGNIKKNNKIPILIAEDSYTNFLYLKKIMKELDVDIIHAVNGLEVIESVKRNKEIELILMDINMPLLNGIEATREVKKINEGITVIAQTAYGKHEFMKDAEDAGCSEFIQKPYNKKELLELIQKYILINNT